MEGRSSVLWGELGVLGTLSIIWESIQRLEEIGPWNADERGVSVEDC